eukprot:CAMPEP_0115147526 /NCGR_PEP_ID=MMETSP0227-20121206/63363_2 /TAXON_ID=89957 /ORGANISM="Polarella glacialis, Strain CCMP 1383" /LENGTH=145 /DNA_ID=CAMNT_0002557451 /DNA_START=278 /DNA_END=713 /DNA_ORIENTATION=-
MGESAAQNKKQVEGAVILLIYELLQLQSQEFTRQRNEGCQACPASGGLSDDNSKIGISIELGQESVLDQSAAEKVGRKVLQEGSWHLHQHLAHVVAVQAIGGLPAQGEANPAAQLAGSVFAQTCVVHKGVHQGDVLLHAASAWSE